jgi:hypothetical protein
VTRLGAIFPPSQAPERLLPVAAAAEASGLAELTGETTVDEVGAALGRFRGARPASRGGPADVVVFTSASAGGQAADIAAAVSEYGRAGATCVAVNTAERDADLEKFVGFLAREVKPLVS